MLFITEYQANYYFIYLSRTTKYMSISQDVQTQFSVQLAFAKFLSKIKCCILDTGTVLKISLF